MKLLRRMAAAVIALSAAITLALAPAAYADNYDYNVNLNDSMDISMPAYFGTNGRVPQVVYKCDGAGVVSITPHNSYTTLLDGTVVVVPELTAKADGVGIARISTVINGVHFDDVYVHVTCSHRWGEWTVISKPVLNVPGQREHVCKDCGAIEWDYPEPPMTDAEYDAMVAADQKALDSIKPKVLTIKKGGKKVVYQFKAKSASGRKVVYECAGATAELKLTRSGKLTVYSNCMRKGKTYRVSVLVSVADWAERVVNVKIKCK